MKRSWILGMGFLAVAVSAATCNTVRPVEPDLEKLSRDIVQGYVPRIRVLLADGPTPPALRLRAPVELLADGEAVGVGVPTGEVLVELDPAGYRMGGEFVAGKTLDCLVRESGGFTLDHHPYRGDLRLVRGEGKWQLINELGLEEYLAGVLASEMPIGWELEALKAQAVAARTYAFYEIREADAKGAAWHVFSDVRSQVYAGIRSESPKALEVVAGTRGQIVVADEGYFPTYFHSTCGGARAPSTSIFGGKPIGALAGGVCGYCETSKHYRWDEAIVDEAALRAGLEARKFKVPQGRILRVEPIDPDSVGHAGRYLVVCEYGRLEVPQYELRMSGGSKLKSSALSGAESPRHAGQLQFSGRGYGHGVGLCQFGAQGMALGGNDYGVILQHYYPGSHLIKMW